MGLDMYLYAVKYAHAFEWATADEKATTNSVSQLFGAEPCKEHPTVTVKMMVGYWRKANAIHRWFVKNVQGGRDECQVSFVTAEQLSELRSACQQVLDSIEMVPGKVRSYTTYNADGTVVDVFNDGEVVAQKGIADKLLPSMSGFFFGGTDYDEGYVDDLKRTTAIIDAALLLAKDSKVHFEYQASW